MATGFYKWCMIPFLSLAVLINGKEKGDLEFKSNKNLHPLHLATVEVEHNAGDKTLEITIKTFWDDFQNILGQINKTTVDLSSDKDKENKNKWIFDYIKKNLQISVDGKPVSLNFVGFEKEDVVIYSYLQADNVAMVKNISLNNSIMQDMFDDQQEIIHVIVNGKRQSTRLDYPKKEAKFSF
jgi:hypothetical protein